MTPAPELRPTRCAICGTIGKAHELYPATFGPEAFTATTFSARRQPDRVHYRMVRCDRCGLLRSDPIADPAILERLYRESVFDESEVANLRRTYGSVLREVTALGSGTDALLEIGSGPGFFLREARDQGFRRVVGVEPSAKASAAARDVAGLEMIQGLMAPGLFPAASFDVVCLFQTLDHLTDPGSVLDECRRVLRPGGHILAFNHDAGALSARILGERSPIVDIEHTYLFDPHTMTALFMAHGFTVLRSGPVRNQLSLRYLGRLLPFPGPLQAVYDAVARGPVGALAPWLPLGNLRLIGRAG